MVNKKIVLLTFFAQLLFSSLAPSSLFAEGKKTKAFYKKEFLQFSYTLLTWAAYVKTLAGDEEIEKAYHKIEDGKIKQFGVFLKRNRDALHGLHRFSDLHRHDGVEVIPNEIYKFLRKNFGVSNKKKEIDTKTMLVYLLGGTFKFKRRKPIEIEGFLDVLDKYDISTWNPVEKFIYDFDCTMATDSKLRNKIGRTISPVLKKYYTFMDVLTRITLFKNLLKEANKALKEGSSIDTETLAVRVFQSSGPLLIKMLQELQEEIVGETEITQVLAELKNCQPMPFKKVKAKIFALVEKLTGSKTPRPEIKEDPIGIASIAQAHIVTVDGFRYVAKLQKEGVADLFYRERKFVQEILNSDDSFDKGMKQQIFNISKGIEEELDFTIERGYIQKGYDLYTDSEADIQGISLPSFVKKAKGKGSKEVLFMSLARGKSVGTIMDENIPEEMVSLYTAIQKLYRKYLDVAMNDFYEENFYHGDLHRENVFYSAKRKMVTMIDFGNAGIISPFVKKSLVDIYTMVEKTSVDNDKQKEEAILKIGNVLEEFIIDSLKKGDKKEKQEEKEIDPLQRSLVKTYFKQCFNPSVKNSEKHMESKFVQKKRESLREEIEELKGKVRVEGKKGDIKKLELKKDNLDFMNAIISNCLDGHNNELVSSLMSGKTISRKVQTIFSELQKNGIAMPQEAIFFNKSNGLLQGMLTNIEQSLVGSYTDFEAVNPDDIFKSALKKD